MSDYRLSLTDNEGKLSNCFSILNQLVGQGIILKIRTETSAKREFYAMHLHSCIMHACVLMILITWPSGITLIHLWIK